MRENQSNDWDTARWLECGTDVLRAIKSGQKGLMRRDELAKPMRAWGVPGEIVDALLRVDDVQEVTA
tara:strand:+ start:536 stop:736 length:201 start_codon:yes stop_codon:yes gene_type:complete